MIHQDVIDKVCKDIMAKLAREGFLFVDQSKVNTIEIDLIGRDLTSPPNDESIAKLKALVDDVKNNHFPLSDFVKIRIILGETARTPDLVYVYIFPTVLFRDYFSNDTIDLVEFFFSLIKLLPLAKRYRGDLPNKLEGICDKNYDHLTNLWQNLIKGQNIDLNWPCFLRPAHTTKSILFCDNLAIGLEDNGSLLYFFPPTILAPTKNKEFLPFYAKDFSTIKDTPAISLTPRTAIQAWYLSGILELNQYLEDTELTKEDLKEFDRRLGQAKQLLDSAKFEPKFVRKINGWILKLDALRRLTGERLKSESEAKQSEQERLRPEFEVKRDLELANERSARENAEYERLENEAAERFNTEQKEAKFPSLKVTKELYKQALGKK